MMNEVFKILVIVCPLVFAAGFVDAVAGGGGIISLPAYLFAGLPAHLAAGCNKFSASFGTVVAAAKYTKSGKVKGQMALIAAVGAIIGAGIGVKIALMMNEVHLKMLMMLALPLVAVFLLTQKRMGEETKPKNYKKGFKVLITFMIGLAIGCYDGLIGPGTGTFLILAFAGILGVDFVTASGSAKIVNLASNLTSVVLFAISGKVWFLIAIPAAVSAMLGGYMGAKFAIKGGSKKVKYMMFVVLALLFIKTAWDLCV